MSDLTKKLSYGEQIYFSTLKEIQLRKSWERAIVMCVPVDNDMGPVGRMTCVSEPFISACFRNEVISDLNIEKGQVVYIDSHPKAAGDRRHPPTREGFTVDSIEASGPEHTMITAIKDGAKHEPPLLWEGYSDEETYIIKGP